MNELDKLNDKIIKILEEKIVLLEDMNVRLRLENIDLKKNPKLSMEHFNQINK